MIISQRVVIELFVNKYLFKMTINSLGILVDRQKTKKSITNWDLRVIYIYYPFLDQQIYKFEPNQDSHIISKASGKLIH